MKHSGYWCYSNLLFHGKQTRKVSCLLYKSTVLSKNICSMLTDFFATKIRASKARSILERIAGIEPALLAWEAKVLPLNYIRVCTTYYATKSEKSQVENGVNQIFF